MISGFRQQCLEARNLFVKKKGQRIRTVESAVKDET